MSKITSQQRRNYLQTEKSSTSQSGLPAKGNIEIPVKDLEDPEFKKQIGKAMDVLMPSTASKTKEVPQPPTTTAVLDDSTDEELARMVEAESPPAEIPGVVPTLDNILKKAQPVPVTPGMVGKCLARMTPRDISLSFKRAAVRMGLPESRHYPPEVWDRIESAATGILTDPVFISKSEERLQGFRRLWSPQSMTHVVVCWAFFKALVSELGI